MPSARSQGGFRLYTEPDVQRLGVIMRMKPLGFQLEEMRELPGILDAVTATFASRGVEAEIIGLNPHSERLHSKLSGRLSGSH